MTDRDMNMVRQSVREQLREKMRLLSPAELRRRIEEVFGTPPANDEQDQDVDTKEVSE